MNQPPIAVIDQVYSAFRAGDLPAVFARFDPSIEWHAAENSPAAKGSPHRGHAAIQKAVFQLLGEEFPDMKIERAETIDAGDTVVALGYYTGHRASTGKSFNAQFAHIWTVANGKVIKFQQYLDTWQMAEAGKRSE
jgi:uncharacterized protein